MKNPLLKIFTIAVLTIATLSCSETLLEETPLSFLNSDNVLTSKVGFESQITALHFSAREELTKRDVPDWYSNFFYGTDVACSGEHAIPNFRNWQTFLTPAAACVANYWNWAYIDMILKANTIVVYANKPELKGIWSNEGEKNAVIAEARFFRAYTYNMLANLYGGVPIVDTIYSGPKTDFLRNTRTEVYQFVKNDLEFASKWLPPTVAPEKEGHIVKAAADHLLSEVYISLGEYSKAIESASRVIDSGLYKLMTERFGKEKNLPGDVYYDMFREGNQNRSSGNMETIYIWQFEDKTQGGQGSNGAGNSTLRFWHPFLVQIRDKDGVLGFTPNDTLGRGGGTVRPTNYFLFNIWKDNWSNDIRNSTYNIKREHYYTNPASKYFGKKVEKERLIEMDTIRHIYPRIYKLQNRLNWRAFETNTFAGMTYTDFIVYRLAETYLLRAEANMKAGNLQKAADDINVVRKRSNGKLITAGDVTIDYILDERARELIAEEPRYRTLVRTGKLIERVRKFNLREDTRTTIQDKHAFWPIPQSAIDANIDAVLAQNPGY